MEYAPTQRQTGKTHHLVRFTAIAENLHAGLVNLTDEAHRSELGPLLYAYVPKPITVDHSDVFDGRSQSESTYAQYVHGLSFVQNANIHFAVEPEVVRPRLSPVVDMIGLRLQLQSIALEKIVAPPLYAAEMRKYGSLPLRYTIPHPGEDIEERVRILEAVLGEGVYFDEVAAVSPNDPARPLFVRTSPGRDAARIEELKARFRAGITTSLAEVTQLDDYRDTHSSGPASA